MTPAESLAGFDDAHLRALAQDGQLRGGSPDPETLRYLEAAINELRELSAGVASAEGVASLAGDVQALGARIDHIAETTGATGLDSLAQRVNELTHALDTRVEQIGPLPSNIESLVKSLTDKLNHSDSGVARSGRLRAARTAASSGSPTRSRRPTSKFGDLGAIERGIQQLTLQVREAREDAIATAERVARTVAADMPRGERRRQRSGAISKRCTRTRPKATSARTKRSKPCTTRWSGWSSGSPRSRPACAAAGRTRRAPRTAQRAASRAKPRAGRAPAARAPEARCAQPPAPIPPHAAAPRRRAPDAVHARAAHRAAADRSRSSRRYAARARQRAARGRSPAERIAASEAALGPALGTVKRDGEVTGKANFIAAARRAAQAAANEGAWSKARAPRSTRTTRPRPA